MALSLGQGAQLVNSVSFNWRIRTAMVRVAIAVSTEVQASLTMNAWVKRRQLATRIIQSPDAMLGSFVAAVAADPGNALSWYSLIGITLSTNASPSVLTTPTHSLTTGDVVEVSNHLVNTAINGTWPVTVISTTTFSIPMPANGIGGASGTVQRQETDANLTFTLNSVFSAVAGLAPGE